MTALNETAPLSAETLAKIRRHDERDLRHAERPDGALDETAWERHVLLGEVDRLTTERDKADAAAKHMGDALAKAGMVMQIAVSTAQEFGRAAGMDVIIGYLSDAGMLPESSVQSDGGA